MNNSNLSLEKGLIYSFYLYAFTFSFTVVGGIIAIGLTFIFWLTQVKKQNLKDAILTNPIAWSSLLFFLLYPVGLFWTDNLDHGLFMLRKHRYLILIPLLCASFDSRTRKISLNIFLFSMLFSVLASLAIFLDLNTIIVKEKIYNTAFAWHSPYSTMLSLAAYITMCKLVNSFTHKPSIAWYGWLIAFILMVLDLYITSGRTGQFTFILLCIVFIFLHFSWKWRLCAIPTLLIIIYLAYILLPQFNTRIHETINDISTYNEKPNSSVGARISVAHHGFTLIKDKYFLGLGTGGYKKSYHDYMVKNHPEASILDTTHSTYLHIPLHFGVLGSIVFITFLLSLLYKSLTINDSWRKIRIGFWIHMITVMISGVVFMGQFTKSLLIFFIIILFTDSVTANVDPNTKQT
ncbi:MAG: O-antigen ligase family protein [Planctomycetes bacterium]|nr:O-antigen ligase family protein [Planctomycetota bacterium]